MSWRQFREPSAVSQVHEWLSRLPVGRVVYSKEARQILSHLDGKHVSAALSLLANRAYGVLEKMPKEGRLQPYRITPEIKRQWYGHDRPIRAGGETRIRDVSMPVPLDPQVRQYVIDTLCDAAEWVEQGGSIEEGLNLIRKAYYALKRNRMEDSNHGTQ